MSTLKDNIAKMIHHLPEDSTLEDIQYHLYVLATLMGNLDGGQNLDGGHLDGDGGHTLICDYFIDNKRQFPIFMRTSLLSCLP